MRKKYKKIVIYSTTFILLLSLFAGCGKKASVTQLSNGSNKLEKPIPRKLKALKMGQADDFALLAYSSIFSNASSKIDGKVGLFPGTKEQITLDPSEVVGGIADILGSDDETTPINLLSNAKVDMVSAYKEALSFSPDRDKIGFFEKNLSAQILPPGCYKSTNDLIINHDYLIEGSDTDVWIFQVPANLLVTKGVHLTLSGGAKARNIFWQVAGNATLESDSLIEGTIIAQQSVELKNHASLFGRAFAKNGFINLNQATIYKP